MGVVEDGGGELGVVEDGGGELGRGGRVWGCDASWGFFISWPWGVGVSGMFAFVIYKL